jgi:hypothetical protein
VCTFGLFVAFGGSAQASTCVQDLNSSNAFGNGTAAADVAAAAVPRAGVAVADEITGKTIIVQLLKGAIGAVGSKPTGYLLEKLGLGAPDYRSQLNEVLAELKTVKTRLDDLQRFVLELQRSNSQGHFSTLVNLAIPVISKVEHVYNEIGLLPTETYAGQKRNSRSILDYICTNLLDKQEELNLRLVGTAPTADNLITSSSKAARDSVRYWTNAQSRAVRNVLDYYVDYEALLLQLRVEWWHAIGASKTYIVAQIEKVDKEVNEQTSLLKPEIARPYGFYDFGQHYFVDVKHPGLVWWPIRVRDVWKSYSAQHQAELDFLVQRDFGGSWDKLGLQPFNFHQFVNYTGVYGGWRFYIGKPGEPRDGIYGTITAESTNDAHEWAVPTFAQVEELISGWQGSPLSYLKANSNPSFSYSLGWYDWGKNSAGNEVIWTQGATPCCGYRLVDLRNGATSGIFASDNRTAFAGVFVVRPADPGGYWYN